MARGTPRPNAAIYYAVDAFDTSRPHLMGRHSAGEGFLRGFVAPTGSIAMRGMPAMPRTSRRG